MQCRNCHQHLDVVSRGPITCPYCGAVNAGAIEHAVGRAAVSAPHRLRHAGRLRGLAPTLLLAVVIMLGGVGGSLLTEHFYQPKAQTTTVSSQWHGDASKLQQARQLTTQGKLDEAGMLLSQINKNYPGYDQVIQQQKIVDAKKAEIAQKAIAAQTKATTPTQKTSASKVSSAAPVAFTSPIQIKGDAKCQSDVLAALQLLSQSAPAHYANATKYLGIIECISQGTGTYAWENPPRYVLGDATRNAGTLWLAGTIAHEAGHARLYKDYQASHPGAYVPADVYSGESAERTCLDAQYDALAQMGAPQSTLDYVKNVINTQYWNVPYDQRWW